jgi:hypothetical protein
MDETCGFAPLSAELYEHESGVPGIAGNSIESAKPMSRAMAQFCVEPAYNLYLELRHAG